MATASVTLQLHQSSFIAGIARAQSAVSSLGASVGRIGSAGFMIAGAAAITFGTAAAIGIKRAFDLGGELADMSAISGRSAKEILLLRRALEDAGVSMEKIDRYILTGQDRGQVIARALENMSSGDWRDAAQSIGKQADILDKNAKTFDRISDLLGRSGQKLQGFFVGAASKIGEALLPLLEKFDKIDLANQGERFGEGLLTGARLLAAFFKNPQSIFGPMEDYLRAAILAIGNLMVATFKTAAALLGDFIQAAFEAALSPSKGMQSFREAINTGLINAVGKNMSGGLTAVGRNLQKQIDEGKADLEANPPPSLSQRMDDVMKANKTKFDVTDVFGAGAAREKGGAGFSLAGRIGENLIPMQGAAGNKKSGGFSFVPASGGVDENAFGSRWDTSDRWNKTAPVSGKADQHLEKISENTQKQTEIMEDAWGNK